MRDAGLLGDTSRDSDRPVDPGRNDAVDALGPGQPFDAPLVLRRDDRAAVGELETRRGRIAVERDHVEIGALASRLEQPELRRPRP